MKIPQFLKKKAPHEFKKGEWAKFVKSFHFDRLSGHAKRTAFTNILGFRR